MIYCDETTKPRDLGKVSKNEQIFFTYEEFLFCKKNPP